MKSNAKQEKVNNMAINNHILEIKLRITYLITCFLITFLVCYSYSLELIYFFVKPLLKYHNIFMFTDLTEALYITLSHCLFCTLFLIIPFIVYQIWCFLIPSSFLCERNKLNGICLYITLFFFLSVYLSYFFILPEIYNFLMQFEIQNNLIILQFQPRIQSYIYLVWKFLILLAVFFQIPLIFYLFFQIRLLTSESLSLNRNLIFIFCLILAALISPPDILSEFALFFFLICNFEIIIWLGFIHAKINYR